MGHPSSQVSELIVDSEMATGANVVGEWLSVSVFTRRDTIGRHCLYQWFHPQPVWDEFLQMQPSECKCDY